MTSGVDGFQSAWERPERWMATRKANYGDNQQRGAGPDGEQPGGVFAGGGGAVGRPGCAAVQAGFPLPAVELLPAVGGVGSGGGNAPAARVEERRPGGPVGAELSPVGAGLLRVHPRRGGAGAAGRAERAGLRGAGAVADGGGGGVHVPVHSQGGCGPGHPRNRLRGTGGAD